MSENVTYVLWACERCGDSKDFPHDEQPIGELKCVVPLYSRTKLPYPICGGVIIALK